MAGSAIGCDLIGGVMFAWILVIITRDAAMSKPEVRTGSSIYSEQYLHMLVAMMLFEYSHPV